MKWFIPLGKNTLPPYKEDGVIMKGFTDGGQWRVRNEGEERRTVLLKGNEENNEFNAGPHVLQIYTRQ